MNTTILLVTKGPVEMNDPTGYVIGTIISLLILGYLLYSLVKPEKF